MTTKPHTRDEPGPEPARLTEDERAELRRLRAENRLLRVERDILMRVASGYARDMEILLQRGTPPPAR